MGEQKDAIRRPKENQMNTTGNRRSTAGKNKRKPEGEPNENQREHKQDNRKEAKEKHAAEAAELKKEACDKYGGRVEGVGQQGGRLVSAVRKVQSGRRRPS